MARTAADKSEVVVQEEPGVTRFKRVVIQRPSGNTDSHIYLGFNSFEGHFEFDKPVDIPADMVDYYRAQKKAEFHPDESGRPVVSYINAYNIIDA
jgi:hypothetical protein